MRRLIFLFLLALLVVTCFSAFGQKSGVCYAVEIQLPHTHNEHTMHYDRTLSMSGSMYVTKYRVYSLEGIPFVDVILKHNKATKTVVAETYGHVGGGRIIDINKQTYTYTENKVRELYAIKGYGRTMGGNAHPYQLAFRFGNNKFDYALLYTIDITGTKPVFTYIGFVDQF